MRSLQYGKATLVEYRAQWPWLRPFALAFDGPRIVEVTSFPYDDASGTACVMGRETIDDPTTNREYLVSDLRKTGWSVWRESNYRAGFADGYAAAVVAARQFRQGGR